MAIIGENDETGLSNFQCTTSQQQVLLIESGVTTYTAEANQEVFRVGIYHGNSSSGDTWEIAVYDITSAVDGATLQGSSGTFAGGGAAAWKTYEGFTPFSLTQGQTYAVALRLASGSAGWTVRAFDSGAANEHLNDTQGTAFSTWDEGSALSQRYGFYAETQTVTVEHYYAIYTSGNGGSATDANVKAGTGTGIVTSGSDTAVDSGTAAEFTATGLAPNTSYDLEWVASDGTNDTRATTTTFSTKKEHGKVVILPPPPIVRI